MHLLVFLKKKLQPWQVSIKAETLHRVNNVISINSLSLVVLALLRGWGKKGIPSLVMNEMNSLTHSCTVSFASFEIFAAP